jgi:hypothetical protein
MLTLLFAIGKSFNSSNAATNKPKIIIVAS